MWQRKVLYQGNSDGIFRYEDFLQFMAGKSQRLSLDNNTLYRREIFSVDPNSTLLYLARKRLVPRGLDLWTVTVTLAGYGIEEAEQKLDLGQKY